MPKAAKKPIMTKKRKLTSDISLADFDYIFENVEKRLNPRFELINSRFDMVDKELKFIHEKFDYLKDDIKQIKGILIGLCFAVLLTIIGAVIKSFIS